MLETKTWNVICWQGNKKKQIPDPKQTSKMKHFYNCLACIMTYNLQTLCLKSMAEFTDYILDVGVWFHLLISRSKLQISLPNSSLLLFLQGKNQGFVINLAFQNDAIEFDPSFKQFRDQIGLLYDFLIDACRQSPRLETLLYQDYIATSRATLKVLNIEKKNKFVINSFCYICIESMAILYISSL